MYFKLLFEWLDDVEGDSDDDDVNDNDENGAGGRDDEHEFQKW